MQKVEGSSPFSRSSESPVFAGLSRFMASRIDPPGGLTRLRIRDGYEMAAGQDVAGFGERAPQKALQDVDRAGPHVQHLLVDAERQLRVGVAEQVHGAPRR